jgi:hypothetical protein
VDVARWLRKRRTRREKENSMRTVFASLVVMALIAVSLGCGHSEYDNPAYGSASVPLRHHGGEHFKVQDYQQISSFYDKMAAGTLTFQTCELDDLPPPVSFMDLIDQSRVAVGIGNMWHTHGWHQTYDNSDPSNPSNTLVNPGIVYNMEMATPYSEPTPFQPLNRVVNGLQRMGNPGWAGQYGSPPPTSANWRLAAIILNSRDTRCDFGYGIGYGTYRNRFIATYDYDGDGVLEDDNPYYWGNDDWPPAIQSMSCWNFARYHYNYDGWGYEFLDISGNSTIRDRDGNEIASAGDLLNHIMQNKVKGDLGLQVSLERVSHPEFGTLHLRRPLNVEIADANGTTFLKLNENIDLVEQLVGHLERSGYRTGEPLDLGGTTLDFGGFTVTMPEDLAKMDINIDGMKKLCAEADRVTTGERGFSRDRVRVR